MHLQLSKKEQVPEMISGHFYHLDLMSECNFTQNERNIMIWVNQVRHPVERFISNYFYYRNIEYLWFKKEYPATDVLNLTEVL